MSNEKYIDFGVARYALPDVCEALFINGVTNGFITLEDGDIHIRWKYDLNRKYRGTGAMDNGGGCLCNKNDNGNNNEETK